MHKSVLSLLVSNKFGVLTKVSILFGRRGCNIHSLSVCPTPDPAFSRMTVTLFEQEEKVVKICKHLMRLEDVREVSVAAPETCVSRSLILARVEPGAAIPESGLSYLQSSELPDGSRWVEAAGENTAIDVLVETLREIGIRRFARADNALAVDD